ncbi:VWA domain-containing protein [Desulfonauticus submarinus]
MYVIKHDEYDRLAFQNVKEHFENIKKTEQEANKELPSFSYLMQDIYSCLYKIRPMFNKKIPASAMFHKTLIEQMLKTSEYKKLHELTKLDEFSSAVATVTMSKGVLKSLSEQQKQELRQQYELEQKLQDLQSKADSLKDLIKKAKNKRDKNKLAKALAKTQKQIQKNKKQIPKPKVDPNQIRRISRKALDQARKETEKLQDMFGWGVDPGQIQKMPVEEKIQLAEKIMSSYKLKKISEIAGRFQRFALYKQETKVKHGRDEVVDTELGNDLARVVPSELAYLINPATKLLFYRKFVEKELLQYSLIGTEKQAKGPIVVCIDNSGSMEGEREIWSKAVMLGLLTIAQKQKRSFAIIHFGSASEIAMWKFNKENPPIMDKLIEILEFFFGGGTDFETPLKTAIDCIKSEKDFKKADIIFITDGECIIPDSFLEQFQKEKKELDFKVYTILVDYQTDAVEKFSDTVLHIGDLGRDDKVLDTIYQI